MPDFVYGRHSVIEALRAGTRPLHKLWMQKGISGPPVDEVVRLARDKGVEVEFATKDQLDRMAKGHHQGVLAEAAPLGALTLDDFLHTLKEVPAEESILVLGLDEIQDPQNVGAILRSAGFFGVRAVLVPKFRSAPITGTAARISSGAVEHVPVIQIRNLADAILDFQKIGFEVYGAEMEGQALHKVQPAKKVLLILGNEGVGLRRLVRERCDKLVAIPGAGKVDSLNVGAAAAIFIYMILRSR